MPFVNGVYKRLQSWRARAAASAPISPVEFDADGDDEASALSTALLRDGSSTVTADLPMSNHTLTGLRPGAATGEAVTFEQLAAAGGGVSNKLHNASFLVNQRGVSGTVTLAAAAYGHDRWKGGAGGCSYTVSTIGADRQASVASGSLLQVVAATDVDSATMTVSNAGTAQARLYASGGTPPGFAACPLTVTNLVPGQAAILEWATGTVLQPQLETGATAHAFARRPLSLDIVLCQAYYEKVPFTVSQYSQGGGFLIFFQFATQKAAIPTPTVTFSSNPNNLTTNFPNTQVSGVAVNFTYNGSGNPIAVGVLTASCEP